MSDYDTDIMVWSEHQAALLCRRAAGQLVYSDDQWAEVCEALDRA
jgi:hypothetical protein